jgi:hypothetical protein
MSPRRGASTVRNSNAHLANTFTYPASPTGGIGGGLSIGGSAAKFTDPLGNYREAVNLMGRDGSGTTLGVKMPPIMAKPGLSFSQRANSMMVQSP